MKEKKQTQNGNQKNIESYSLLMKRIIKEGDKIGY